MNDNIKISFIPKKPLAKGEFVRAGSPIFSLSFVIATSVVVIMVIVALAEIGWKEFRTLERNRLIAELKAEVEILEETDVFKELESIRALERRIELTNEMLDQHIASSRMLKFVEETTLPQILFANYNYTHNAIEKQVELSMDGIAPSFADLAAQSAVYRDDGRITQYRLDSFSIKENGSVQFKLEMVVSDTQLAATYGTDDLGPESRGDTSTERARAALRLIETDLRHGGVMQAASVLNVIDANPN